MELWFESEKLCLLCNDREKLHKKFGSKIANNIDNLLAFLDSFSNLHNVPKTIPFLRKQLTDVAPLSFSVGDEASGQVVFCTTKQEDTDDLTKIDQILITEIKGAD